jgi:hypothetical protein
MTNPTPQQQAQLSQNVQGPPSPNQTTPAQQLGPAAPTTQTTDPGDIIGPIVNFIVLICLINAATLISTAVATSTGGVISRGIRRAGVATSALGIGGYAGRNIIGKKAYNLSQNKDLQDRAAMGGLRGFWARQQLKAYKTTAGASFDATGALGKKVGTGAEVGKGGYSGYVKERIKEQKKIAEGLGKGDLFRLENGKLVTGGSIYNKYLEQARKEGIRDVIAQTKRADELYKAEAARLTKTRAEGGEGARKMSRKEAYAEEKLRKGNLLQQMYAHSFDPLLAPLVALKQLKKAPLGIGAVAGAVLPSEIDKVRFGSYQGTYVGDVEAARELLKNVKKEGKKGQLGKLKKDRDRVKGKINNIENTIDSLEEKRIAGTITPDETARLNALKVELKTNEDKLNEIESDISEGQEKDSKDKEGEGEGKKSGETEPKTT